MEINTTQVTLNVTCLNSTTRSACGQGSHAESDETERVDAVLYVVVVLALYTSAMVILLVKYLKRETRESHIASYFTEYINSTPLSNAQDENKKRLKDTQKLLKKLYGPKWTHFYTMCSQHTDTNYRDGEKQISPDESSRNESSIASFSPSSYPKLKLGCNERNCVLCDCYSEASQLCTGDINITHCLEHGQNISGVSDGKLTRKESSKVLKHDTYSLRRDSGYLSPSQSSENVQRFCSEKCHPMHSELVSALL